MGALKVSLIVAMMTLGLQGVAEERTGNDSQRSVGAIIHRGPANPGELVPIPKIERRFNLLSPRYRINQGSIVLSNKSSLNLMEPNQS